MPDKMCNWCGRSDDVKCLEGDDVELCYECRQLRIEDLKENSRINAEDAVKEEERLRTGRKSI